MIGSREVYVESTLVGIYSRPTRRAASARASEMRWGDAHRLCYSKRNLDHSNPKLLNQTNRKISRLRLSKKCFIPSTYLEDIR